MKQLAPIKVVFFSNLNCYTKKKLSHLLQKMPEKPREVLKDDGLLAAFLICFVVFVSCLETKFQELKRIDPPGSWDHVSWHQNLGLSNKVWKKKTENEGILSPKKWRFFKSREYTFQPSIFRGFCC